MYVRVSGPAISTVAANSLSVGLFLKHETIYSSFNSRKVGLDSLSVIILVVRYSYIYANMTHNSGTTTIHSMSLYHIIHNSWCSQLTEVRDGQ